MATLVYSDVDGIDRTIAIGMEPITIGRSAECAIQSQDPRVSRVHARFFVESGVLWIEDLGSANGVFVGPNRVQRAPVPTAEIILVGSLMIRLLPASGTLPPPMGLHGTLAQWLSMERKSKTIVEEERDAFAQRVGQLHQQIAAAPPAGDPEAIRLRDEAIARSVSLEHALAAIQDELASTRSAHQDDASSKALEEALLAQEKEAQGIRDELDKVKKSSQGELEAMRVEMAKLREAKSVAETQAGMAVAEKLANADFRIADLERELAKAQGPKEPSGPDPKLQQLGEQVTTLIARAEKAERELANASIRAQGAERNLSGAQSQASMAELRAQQAEHLAAELEAKLKMRDVDAGAKLDRLEELEKTVVPGMVRAVQAQANLEADKARTAKLETDFAELTSQFETRRDRLVELETAAAAQAEAVRQAEDLAAGATAQLEAAKTELAGANARAAEADKRLAEMKARLDAAGGAESAISLAVASKEEALGRAAEADVRAQDAERRADEAEKRAGAADTMQKAMAKDVAEALRRAAEADSKAKANVRDLAEARTRTEELDRKLAELDAGRAAAETARAEKEAELAKVGAELAAKLAKLETEHLEHVAASQRDAAAKAEAHQRELQTSVEAVQRDLADQHETVTRVLTAQHETATRELIDRHEASLREQTQRLEQSARELSTKLEQVTRELQAERTSSLALVDRKAQLERELTEATAFAERTEAAESRVVELEVQLESMQEKIEDLESGLAVAETSRQASVDDERGKTKGLEKRLREAEILLGDTNNNLDELRTRAAATEDQLRAAEQKLRDAEQQARDAVHQATEAQGAAAQHALEAERTAQQQIAEAQRTAEEKIAAGTRTAQERANEATRQAEEKIAAAQRATEQALAEARSQLADAIRTAESARGDRDADREKLEDALQRADRAEARIEGLARSAEAADLAIGRAAALQRQLDEAIAKLSWLERDLAGAKGTGAQEIQELAQRLAEAEKTSRGAEQRARDSSARLGDLDRNARDAEGRVQELEKRLAQFEQRAIAAEQRAIAAEADAASAGVSGEELDEARDRITELEQELQKADNVRSFAAETEREIAGMQRELRELKSNLTRVTLERDRMESELRDSREDSETRDRAITPGPDIAKFNKMMARVSEIEKDNTALRTQLEQLKVRLLEAEEKAESTATNTHLPLGGVAEQVSIIEESIDSLRSNMRAASDETAMMDQSESVVAVSSAVSQAAEHIERARVAIKSLVKTFNS